MAGTVPHRTARARRVFVGTSGFSYPAWRGPFYPPDLPPREMLGFYAQALPTVEINHTFHRPPTANLLIAWRRQTPPGFRFALKAPRRITHQLRLRDAGDVTTRFLAVVRALGAKLGPLLFQLPPYLRFDPGCLAAFLALLPPRTETTVEFRSETWFNDETYALLGKHGVALCIADADAFATPAVATAPFGYVRLRRAAYTPADLDLWAGRVRAMPRWTRAYVYFKHEESGLGPALAGELQARLA